MFPELEGHRRLDESAVPNRPLRAFNARKNPGVADGDTKSAPVGFPAQRTNVESAGPGQTSSSGVTLTAVTVSYLGSGQVGWARGSYSRRTKYGDQRVRVEDCQ